MFPTDPTGELCRQRIADLHAQANRQRLARSVPARPTSLRLVATAVLLAAPAAVVLVETAGRFVP